MGDGPFIGIPSGNLCSFNTALIEFVNGQLRLKNQRTLNENFNAALNAAIWQTILSGTGALTIYPDGNPLSVVEGTRPANADVANFTRKTILDITSPFRLKWITRLNSFTSSSVDLYISSYSALPTINDQGTLQFFTFWRSANRIDLLYQDTGGTFHYWNGSIWTTTQSGIGVTFKDFVQLEIINNGTSFKIRMEDEHGVLITETASVNWSTVKAPGVGEDTYIVVSDIRTATSVGQYNNEYESIILWLSEEGFDYSNTSPVATSPWFAIDQNTLDAVTAILLQLILEGTATIKFQYGLNNGAFNGSFLTPAQVLAALVSQSITDKSDSMRLMFQFNSNGFEQAAILLPETRVEASGITGVAGGGSVTRSNIF